MSDKKNCKNPNCNKRFEYINPYKKYCSYKCRDEHRAIKHKGLIIKDYSKQPLKEEIFKRDNYKCFYCGKDLKDRVGLQIEHLISKYNGGNNQPDNLVTSCSVCNIKKGWKNYKPEIIMDIEIG